jgi:hypothetical protein
MKWIKFISYQLAKLIMYPYGLIVYPLAYVLRKVIRKYKKVFFILWVVLDDEEDYGEPFFMVGRKKNFWTSYQWAAIRNNCWNFHSLFSKKVAAPHVFPTKRLKWEYREPVKTTEYIGYGYRWVDGWTVNKGERLSERYSTLGWDNRDIICLDSWGNEVKLWTISYAGRWKWFLINIKLGWNDLGQQIIEFKVKIYKKYYTNHWENPLH